MVGPSSPSPVQKAACCQNRTHYTMHFRAKGKGVSRLSLPTPSSRLNGGLGAEAPVIFFEGRAVFIQHTGF